VVIDNIRVNDKVVGKPDDNGDDDWDQLKDSTSSFGQSVKKFFTRLVGK
jgi:hypothetical protein